MAVADKYNLKQIVLVGGSILNRYHQGDLNYLGIQTKFTIQRDWTLDRFIRRINKFVIIHIICTPNCS